MKKFIYAFIALFTLVAAGLSPTVVSAQTYCSPSFSSCATSSAVGDSITFFQFGSYSRTAPCLGYDTTQTKTSVITVYRGKTYGLNVVASNSSGTDQFGVWIDYDKNGSFEDTTELVAGDFNGNGTFSQMKTNITIPIGISPKVTRMRVMTAHGSNTMNYKADCNTWSTAGSDQDYKITIAAYPHDIGMIALNSPQNDECPSNAAQVKITIRNIGTTDETNIPFVIKYGTTTINSTYTRKLKANTQDTFTVGYINASTSGTYKFAIYAKLSGDGDATNDTINASVSIRTPSVPTLTNTNHCGPGSVYLKGLSKSAGSSTYWFSSSTSTTPLAIADSILVPYMAVGKSATYYAESRYPSSAFLQKGSWSQVRSNRGNMFDVFAKRTLAIDSLDVNSGTSGSTDSVTVYYREGSYYGAELTASDWIKFGTFPFLGKGPGNASRVRLTNPINLDVSKTYGFYLVPYSANLYYDITDTTNNPKSNTEITITAGTSTGGLFSTVAPNRDWNGVLYYHFKTCNSARVTGTLSMLQNPTGATLAKSTPFKGSYASGSKKDPDQVCIGDTNTYSLTPPTNMTNADFGTKWVITGVSFSTATGVVTKDTIMRLPSGSKNAYVKFFPGSKPDSVYIMKVTIKTPTSGCDSTVFRYIQVNAQPLAKFTASDVCTGKVMGIVNSSTPSKDTYKWYFGNGDSATGATPAYKYLTAGTYTVTLIASNGPCSSAASQKITVYPSPISSIIKGTPFGGVLNTGDQFDPDNICVGDTNTYSIAPPKGMSNSEYGTKWTITNMSFATIFGTKSTDSIFKKPTSTKSATFSFLPTVGFGDSVLLLKFTMRTLPGGCDSLMTRYVHVRVKPIAGFKYTNSCIGSAIDFKDTSKSKISILSSWSWDFGDKTTPVTTQNASHYYAKAGKYTVTLKTVTDAGCSATATGTVEQYPSPTTKFSSVLGCNTFISAFTDSSFITTGAIASWNWSFGDGKTAVSNFRTPTYTYAKSGPYNVKLVTTSTFGCKDSITKRIRIQARPVASLDYKNVCVGAPMYFVNKTSDSSAKAVNSWSFGDGTTYTGVTPPGHVYKNNGSYRVSLHVVSPYGCEDSFYLYVTPSVKPIAKLTLTNACVGRTATFIDSGGAPLNSTYAWDFGDGNTDFQKTNSVTHVFSKSGTYKVSELITNPGGCPDTQSRNITILDIPKPSFTNTTVCYKIGTQFTNTSTGPAPLTYAWDFNDNGSAIDRTNKNPNHTFSQPGVYAVKLLALNSLGCYDSISQNVTVVALPDIKWIRKQDRYTVNFVPVDSTIGNWTWYFGTGTDSSSKKSPTFTYPTGDFKYQIKIVVKNSSGCTSTLTDSIFTGKYNAINEAKNTFGGVSVYPNPFAGVTSINYNLQARSDVNIAVYDAQGKMVARLKEGSFPAGAYTDEFDARKYNTSEGVYYLRMYVNDMYYSTKIINMSK